MINQPIKWNRRIPNQIISLTVAVCLFAGTAAAATPPPDSGAALQSVKQPENQPPAATAPGAITINEPETAPPSGNQQKIRVNGFRLSGETIVPEQELLQLIADQAGLDLTLGDLNGLAARITKYLRQKGYLVASAYLPAQQVKDGIVTIAVIPGKYGEMKINNQAHIQTARLEAILTILQPETIITRQSLERALLLLNDLAGVQAKVTLTPGRKPGTADLIVAASDTAKINGNANADNWGSRYTGQTRGGVQVNLNNLAQLGDALNLSGLTTGNGMSNGGFDYAIPLFNSGLKLDLKYSHVNYALGADFADLGASGTAAVYGAGLSYPLIRSRNFNLYGSFGFDGKQLKDVVGNSTNTPRTSSLWNIGIAGNAADAWGNGGLTSFSLTYSAGNLTINDSNAAAQDASSANTAGRFQKLGLSGSRRQFFASNFNLDLLFSGQLAGKNLDSSEKFYLGGADGVRAYPQGEAAGDQGFRLTMELQAQLVTAAPQSSVNLALFSDYGYVTVNRNPWDGSVNTRSLCDAGLGVIFTTTGFTIRCDYAWKIGAATATSDTDQPGRFWVRAVKSF